MIKPLMIKITPLNDDAESCKKLEVFIKTRYETSLLADDDDSGKYLLPIDVKDDVLANLSQVSDIIIVDKVEYDVKTQTELSETNLYAPGEGLSEDAASADDAQVSFSGVSDNFINVSDVKETMTETVIEQAPKATAQEQPEVPKFEPILEATTQFEVEAPQIVPAMPAPSIAVDPSAEDEGIGVMPELKPFSTSAVMESVKDLLIPIETETDVDPVVSMEAVEDEDELEDDDDRHQISLQSMTLIPDQASLLDELTTPLSVEFAEPNIQLDMLRQQCEMMWNSNIALHQNDVKVLFSSDMSDQIQTLRDIAQNDASVDRFEAANDAYIKLQETMQSELDEIYAKYENDLKAWLDEQIKLLEAKYRQERPDTETDAAAAAFIAEATPILKQESDKLIALRSKAQNQIIYAAMRDSQKSGVEYTPILSALSCIAFKHNMEEILYNAERTMTANTQQSMAQPVQPPMATMNQVIGQMSQAATQTQVPVIPEPIVQQPVMQSAPQQYQPQVEPQFIEPEPMSDPGLTAVIPPIVSDDPFETGSLDPIDDKLAHSQHAKSEPEPIADDMSGFDMLASEPQTNSSIDQVAPDFDNLPSLFADADPSDEVAGFDDDLGIDSLGSSIDDKSMTLNGSSDGLGDSFSLDDMLGDLESGENSGAQQPGSQTQQGQDELQFDPDAKPPKKKMSLVKKIAIIGSGIVLAGGIACGAMLFMSQPSQPSGDQAGQEQSQNDQSNANADLQAEVASKFAKGDKLRVGVGGQLTDVVITDSNEYGMIVEDSSQNQYQLTWDQLKSYIDAHPEEFADDTTNTEGDDQSKTGDQPAQDQQAADQTGGATGTETPANDNAPSGTAATDQTADTPAILDEPASNNAALTTEEVKAASTGGSASVVDGGRG